MFLSPQWGPVCSGQGLTEPSRAGEGWGGTERMLGTEKRATRTDGEPHVPGLSDTTHAVNMLTYTYTNIRAEVQTCTQTHTSAHTHCGAKPINTLPPHRSFLEQWWSRRAYVDNHTCKLDEQERHRNSGSNVTTPLSRALSHRS